MSTEMKPVKGYRYKVYDLSGETPPNVELGTVIVEHKHMGVRHGIEIVNLNSGEPKASIGLVYIGEREMPGKFRGPLVENLEAEKTT